VPISYSQKENKHSIRKKDLKMSLKDAHHADRLKNNKEEAALVVEAAVIEDSAVTGILTANGN
jgi:hypothetical protein